jgi:hypothetical protein
MKNSLLLENKIGGGYPMFKGEDLGGIVFDNVNFTRNEAADIVLAGTNDVQVFSNAPLSFGLEGREVRKRARPLGEVNYRAFADDKDAEYINLREVSFLVVSAGACHRWRAHVVI